MKKQLLATALAVLMTVGLTACGEEQKSTAALAYDDGNNADGSYNTDLFYRNDMQLNHAADPDCIWVSEEENAEWGGWFYLYSTNVYYNVQVMRSKDLNVWETVGLALDFDGDEWTTTDIWAPEVTYNPADGKYYMYSSADAVDASAANASQQDLFVAVSDNPAGGFRLAEKDAYGREYSHGESNLSFRTDHIVQKGSYIDEAGLDVDDWIYDTLKYDATGSPYRGFYVIDPSPFCDDDGQWYLYLRVRLTQNGEQTNKDRIGVVKLIDMVTPDYSSFKFLTYQSYRTVEDAAAGNQFALEKGTSINEAPHMIKHNGIYYLTFAFGGYTQRTMYCVSVAVSDDPMGDFIKLAPEDGNPSLYIEGYMDHVSGPGHHCFVEVGDEVFVVYHVMMDRATANSNPRAIAIDRVEFINGNTLGVKASDYGLTTETGTFDILYSNGATWSLQPLAYSVSGYRNLAKEATVSATNGKASTTQYLNDGLFANHTLTSFMEYEAYGATTIKLSWKTPVSVSAIMVYNSFDFRFAFSQVDNIEFELAEQPASWHGDPLDSVYIKDLAFNANYWNSEESFMRPGGSCHAAFNEIKVNSITITISQKLDQYKEEGDGIKVSDIVVLGKGV